MSLGKKCALIFLVALNLINFAAAAIVDYKIIASTPVTKILPHNFELSSVQTMLLDFTVLCFTITLISIVTTYLVTDVPYSPIEIMKNFAFIFFTIPLALGCVAVYGMFTTPLNADKPWIIVCTLIYLLLNAINISCAVTVREDE